MARYTLEISQLYRTELLEDNDFKIFSFDYDFYIDNPDIKANFEKKFIEYYYFNEIGCETVGRWKHMLKAKLNRIMPYYKQLYITELKSKDLNFLFNKDLKETYTREILANAKDESSANNKSNSTDTSNTTGNNSYFESDTPHGSIDNLEKYMSGANKGSNSQNSNNTNNTDTTTTASSNQDSNSKESYELLSQGNIGITSTGQLLEDWRKVLINIDELIIFECEDLFMQIF